MTGSQLSLPHVGRTEKLTIFSKLRSTNVP